jgi:DNA-binding NarL/FixJ family response regulator
MAKVKQAIRVMVADDHVIFRQGVRKLLEGEGDISIVGETAKGKAPARYRFARLEYAR